MSCHHRQFNETLFLPLCTSSKDSKGKEHIYQVVVRGTVRASNNNRLVGIWSEPQITSFQCNQGMISSGPPNTEYSAEYSVVAEYSVGRIFGFSNRMSWPNVKAQKYGFF